MDPIELKLRRIAAAVYQETKGVHSIRLDFSVGGCALVAAIVNGRFATPVLYTGPELVHALDQALSDPRLFLSKPRIVFTCPKCGSHDWLIKGGRPACDNGKCEFSWGPGDAWRYFTQHTETPFSSREEFEEARYESPP